ncbi:hypothetical protein H6P81_016077 [Aristolochia fimbriata]|uniref:Uncharacterized protein n=1 Tax=Aristolochia fimbriata TaxID=158543 RepID=A0AAV7EAH3_ARIFI|nr:hypothetical protein H6P81_016077 [Aristolochia fimbriata]
MGGCFVAWTVPRGSRARGHLDDVELCGKVLISGDSPDCLMLGAGVGDVGDCLAVMRLRLVHGVDTSEGGEEGEYNELECKIGGMESVVEPPTEIVVAGAIEGLVVPGGDVIGDGLGMEEGARRAGKMRPYCL